MAGLTNDCTPRCGCQPVVPVRSLLCSQCGSGHNAQLIIQTAPLMRAHVYFHHTNQCLASICLIRSLIKMGLMNSKFEPHRNKGATRGKISKSWLENKSDQCVFCFKWQPGQSDRWEEGLWRPTKGKGMLETHESMSQLDCSDHGHFNFNTVKSASQECLSHHANLRNLQNGVSYDIMK